VTRIPVVAIAGLRGSPVGRHGDRTRIVYTVLVKNITLSADENLIEQARQAAAEQHTTLNAAFREWLEQFSGRARRAREFDEFMERMKYFSVDRKYTRDELNER
jgi:hypothetical protein